MLSQLIFDADSTKVKEFLIPFEDNPEYLSKIINTEDQRGFAPLFLCIYLRESYKDQILLREAILEIIKILFYYGVKIRIRNEDGRTPLEEAVAYEDKETVVLIYERALINRENRVKLSKDKANAFMTEVPDFYAEMKWEVNVPLISFLCPNDTCKIWKQGSNIRMDYTFIEMKGLSAIRAPTSFIYEGSSGKTSLVNWETKRWFNQLEPLENDEKDLVIQDILEGTRLNSEIKLKGCIFDKSMNWRGKPVYEKVNGYLSQVYNVKIAALFDLHHQQKLNFEKLDKETYFNFEEPLKKSVHLLNSNEETKKKLAKNLKIKNDMMKKSLENFGKTKDKNLKAIVWVAEDYPFNFQYMIHMINSLSSANEFISKLKEFFKDPEFQNILDRGGFPIKIKIPINFLIDVTMTFGAYKYSFNLEN